MMMWVLSNKFRWQAVIRKEGLILFLFIPSIHHVEMLKARHDTGDAIVCGIFHNLRLSIFEVSTRKFMHMHNSVNSSVSLFGCCSHAWYFRINIKLKSYIFASNINECVHYPPPVVLMLLSHIQFYLQLFVMQYEQFLLEHKC